MAKRGILLVALCCCAAPSAQAAEVGQASKATAGEVRTLPGGAVLRFSKDAKYELGHPIKLQLSPTGSEKTPVQVIKLSAGRVTVVIPALKTPKTAVLIQAPRKVSAVAKGGESLVISGSDRVTIAALSGEMLAALGNDWKPLASGVVRSFGGGLTSEQPAPAPPKLSADHTMLLALDGSVGTNLRAAPSPNVAFRELALYRVEANGRSKLSEAEWRSDMHSLQGLSPGRYEVQARAVDRFGVESVTSSPLTLRVIGAELPEGARLANDSILLGRSGRVKLIGADGLEVSYGHATLFVPVPKDVGLARGDSTLLRLREPGAKEEVGIKLEPRTLRADVVIGPKTAHWPQDPLEVSVKLFDHQGHPMSDALKHKPNVFVNVEPIASTWMHSGNTWTTRVAPTPGSGPWVVRVEVKDDFGEQVGRDFIELAAD
jgi:hypothetical protein